jgi:hypothetical protein
MPAAQCILGLAMNTAAEIYTRRFEADTRNAVAVNEKVLKKILHLNRDSAYGCLHKFQTISNVREYKQKVPLTTYNDYEPYIERMVTGEKNILTSFPVIYFGLSSGTTGRQKLIPVTSVSRKLVNTHMMLLTQGILHRSIPGHRSDRRGLLLMNSARNGSTSGGIPVGAATSSGMASMKAITPYLWTSPPEILELTDQRTALYLHLLFALREKELGFINAPFPSSILQLFRILEEEWSSLAADLAEGSLSEHLNLEPEIRKALQKRLLPDSSRAEQLASEIGRGMSGIALRLWPRMQYICCVAGGSFKIYMDKLQLYTGQLPVYSAVYGATEAMVGIAIRPGEASYVLTPRTAFFEFIPADQLDESNPVTLNLNQLEPGQSYEVVVTNYAGFYRYRLGDIIKVTGYFNNSPVIEFLQRKGQLLNLVGEKTLEEAVYFALGRAARQLGFILVDYTTALDLDTSPGRYLFFVEVLNPEKLADMTRCRYILEKALEEANPRYGVNLKAGRIGNLSLRVVKPGTFKELQQRLISKGASMNQVKVPRLVEDEKLLQFLSRSVIKINAN